MADKKISALTQVADSDIGADDLLHIVDNPGGTPVNKKMTIGQLFENIPTHLAVDDINTLTATASNLASTFATAIDGSAWSANVAFTLDDGTDTGQIKVIYASTEPASSYSANITVSSWGYSTDTTEQIVLDTRGEAVILIWDGSNWFPISTVGATLS
jgi:hypothetical protein